jgi:hypothetical protein
VGSITNTGGTRHDERPDELLEETTPSDRPWRSGPDRRAANVAVLRKEVALFHIHSISTKTATCLTGSATFDYEAPRPSLSRARRSIPREIPLATLND